MNFDINGLEIGVGTDFELSDQIEGLETPEIRTSSRNYSGRDGGFVSGQYYNPRLITISGFIKPQTCEEHEIDRAALQSSLPIRTNLPVTITTYSGRTYTTTARLSDLKMPFMHSTLSSFKIDLIAPDPNLYTSSHSQVIPLTQSGGFILPVIFPVVFAPGSSDSVVTNSGAVEVSPVFTIVGTTSSPIRITNTDTNEYVEINVSLSSGDTLVIDMLNRTTLLNGSSVRSFVTNDDWFKLQPGANHIKYTTGNQLDSGVATLSWKTAVLGI